MEIPNELDLLVRRYSEKHEWERVVVTRTDCFSHGYIQVVDIDLGTVDRVNPSVREILITALKYQSPAMIVAHNHPSGNVEPSESDKILTKDLLIAARAMELRIFDHVIIGENNYFSFADEGLIEDYEMEVTK